MNFYQFSVSYSQVSVDRIVALAVVCVCMHAVSVLMSGGLAIFETWTDIAKLCWYKFTLSQNHSQKLKSKVRENIRPVKPPASIVFFSTILFILVIISVFGTEFHSLVVCPPFHFRVKPPSEGVTSCSRVLSTSHHVGTLGANWRGVENHTLVLSQHLRSILSPVPREGGLKYKQTSK